MFPTLVRRLADKAVPPFKLRSTVNNSLTGISGSPYKTKKRWPPDFSKLSQKEQFRLEKRYKRRVKLATMRPRWDKYIRLAQLFSITFVLIYSVLFMDWNTDPQPFQGIRNTLWGALDSFSPQQRHERRNPSLPPGAGTDEK
ncbi:hypothetical protein GGR56DRAFT_673303 [Xylariaceae sp. FL0804]|nr:hypothetical protein GGR56DRAFT_673303 [Xylariaceae sp. FL0804]